MAPAIPDRWIPYSCSGSVIAGTKLICFKVPLKKNVLQNSIRNGVKIDEIWDIEALLQKIPKLRFVIDLTNTDRYYDPKMLVAKGVEHIKIGLPGRIIPPEGAVTRFFTAVERCLQQSDEDSLVGVHCTHGLNRTGYMVCRYLRDKLSMSPEKAIEIFEAARGYKIERENYLADLKGKEGPPPDFNKDTVIKPIEPCFQTTRFDEYKIPSYYKERNEQYMPKRDERWEDRNSWRDDNILQRERSWRDERNRSHDMRSRAESCWGGETSWQAENTYNTRGAGRGRPPFGRRRGRPDWRSRDERKDEFRDRSPNNERSRYSERGSYNFAQRMQDGRSRNHRNMRMRYPRNNDYGHGSRSAYNNEEPDYRFEY